VWLPAWLPRPARAGALVVVFKNIPGFSSVMAATCVAGVRCWLVRQDHPAYIPRPAPARSWLRVEPDGDTGCCGQPDRAGAARAPAADERCAPVRPEGDHLGVSPVSGRSPVPAPVCGVRLDLVAGGPGGAGVGDRVGSAGACAVDQQDALGVPVEDQRQGLLDDVHVVPGAAAGHQEPERLAHDRSPPLPADHKSKSGPAQTPPPNPAAAGLDDRRVLSGGGGADHAVTPKAPLTGSGCREHSYGGFGGGHPPSVEKSLPAARLVPPCYLALPVAGVTE
jgi:hypothetical protein